MMQTIEQFRAAAKAGTAQAGARLRKQFVAQIKAAGDSGPVAFTLSTATPDRVRDTIAVTGWDTANYRKNPVVLWAHDASQPPVGRSLREWSDEGGLHGEVEFASEVYPFAKTVEGLVRGGFLNAVSVGFAPKEWTFDEERGGVDFVTQELLEYSVVPIPANPEALAHAKSDGIDIEPVVEWCAKTLEAARVRGEMARRIARAVESTMPGKTYSFTQRGRTVSAPSAKGLLAIARELKMDEPADAEEPKAEPEQTAEEMPKAMACESCGAVYDEGDKFCRACGSEIKAAPAEGEDAKGDDETDPAKAIAAAVAAGFAPAARA